MNPYGNGMWVKLLSVAVVFAFLISGAAIALSSDVSEPSVSSLAPTPISEPADTVDLSIADEDLSVSDSEPVSGTPLTVSATVHGDPSASATSSEKSLVFSDDFGTGTLSKWIKTSWNPSGLLEVSSAVSNTTPYSLHCQSDPGTNTGPYVMKFLDGAYAHSITETMFYLPAKAQSMDKWDIIRVGSSTGTVFSTTNYEFYIALRDDDYSIDLFEYVKDASGVWSYGCLAMDVYELTPQTWNKVSLEITPTDYALRVGETTVASGERTASTLIHHLLLGDEGGSAGCWGDSYWDDVKVWSVTESQVSEPGLDAICTVEFYLDAVDPANLIGSVDNVFVPAGGGETAELEWNPVAGEHDVIALVTDVNPGDADLSNNQASVSVTVADQESAGSVDLSLSNGDIATSTAEPRSGEPLTITATVHGDVSVESDWEKQGVALDIGGTGESLHVVSPSVLVKEDGTYVMYYTASELSGYNFRIFRAESTDGINWVKKGVALNYGGAYAGVTVYHPYVMVIDGIYHMWYNGVNLEDGYRGRILHATSADGITFIPTGLDLNFGTSVDPAGVHCPFVMNDDGTYRMWYQGTYWSPNFNRICLAEKANLGDAWVREGTVLSNDGQYDSANAVRPWVMKLDDGTYEMFYSGSDSSSVGRILRATSPDGVSWSKDGIVIAPTLPQEGQCVYYPCVLDDEGTYKMWYSGYSGTNWRIFYAEKGIAYAAQDATCSVSFYMDSVTEANLISTVENVAVPADGQTPVSIEWVPVAGEHQIIAVVTDVVPEDRDSSNNMASVSVSVAESGPAEVTVQKVRLTGPEEGITHTYYEWELQITVTNVGASAADSVKVFDVLPAELELMEMVPSTGSTEFFCPVDGGTRAAPAPDTVLPQKSTHITWIVGTLEPGQSETLYMKICTRLNPADQQEFTSPGTYIINEGACAKWIDTHTGTEVTSGRCPAITVEISELVINVIENPHVPLPKTWFFMIMSFGCFIPGFARKRKQ